MKKIIHYFCLLGCMGIIYASQTEPVEYGGIRFFSYYDDDQPTVLDLTPNSSIPLKDPFTLSFDLAIWKTTPFGFITSGREGGETLFLLTYIDYQHPDTSYFELSFGSGSESLSIGLPKSELNKQHWFHTELTFDLDQDFVSMKIGNIKKSRMIPLTSSVNLNLSFGANPFSQDTPNMDIRRIHLQNRYWPLNEGIGTVVTEQNGNENGILKGGSWLVKSHMVWKKTYSKMLNVQNNHFIYNQNSNSILVWSGDSLTTIDCDTWSSSTQLISEPMNEKLYLVEDGFNQAIIGFNGGGNSVVATWNETKRAWDNYDPLSTSNEYYESRSVVDPRNGDVYMIGGYGHYKVKNHIQKYDKETETWTVVPVTNLNGELFNPRGSSAATITKSGESIFIFGGLGNESGDQKKGFRYFYDLWQFNVDNLTLEKLWEWDRPPAEMEPKSVLIIPERNEIYMLGEIESEMGDSLLFYRSPLNHPNFEIIQFSESMRHPIGMFFLDKTNELGLIKFENRPNANTHVLSILTIGLPIFPTNSLEDQASLKMFDEMSSAMWILLLGIIIVGSSLYGWRQKQKWVEIPSKDSTNVDNPSEVKPIDTIDEGISIKVNDEFQLWVDGKSIAINGNGRHKQIVQLMTLVANSPENKLSHEDIQQSLWPLVQDESFVNSLNVTLSALRKVISPYEKEIIHQNKTVAFGKGIRVIHTD
ncbi:MAG: hypothetical protein HOL09_08025 [Candidatus Marinimicrobia bacterium]|nr:hypothetical protein [Candidatus Neomarinimicrobiota bacterium]MBT3764009.1 hypothetical protein [Candidatus Neomarinimicrobiota bacterium]MBT4053892.1 hypothetical protein [Candidatus Neomarinimicrobiota bacterium]MBT4635726.1 hypothetical protein [Candidatus Neomarinimicrobiota bacterium]MBT5386832.1 hypothetical protein [Candidatus Neomarinimicrobiota bacterium]